MIKSVTQVVFLVMLSFGALAVAINPTLQAKIQVAGMQTSDATVFMFSSANVSLFNLFSGEVSGQRPVAGLAAAPVNTNVSVNTTLDLGALIQSITANLQSATSTLFALNSK